MKSFPSYAQASTYKFTCGNYWWTIKQFNTKNYERIR